MAATRPFRAGTSEPLIYVQMPAYRDTELAATVTDLYAKAAHPDRLRLSVLWQKAASDRAPASLRRLPGLELIEVPFEKSKGCNWARRRLQRGWRGEPYTLLIDSHHRFVEDWDATTVSLYESLKGRGVKRPLLTAYLPPYFPEREPYGRARAPLHVYPFERENGVLTRLTSYPIHDWKRLRSPVQAEFISLHFLFTDGRFNRDVPFDPLIYFLGDEASISVRAFTRGFDLFHPHVILGWHCYDRRSRVTHWTDHPIWSVQHRRSMRRLARLYKGGVTGPAGLGRARSVRQFEERSIAPLIQEGD